MRLRPGAASWESSSKAMPEVWASRCRTVAPAGTAAPSAGPAGGAAPRAAAARAARAGSRFGGRGPGGAGAGAGRARSTATRTVRAVSSLVTEAQGSAVSGPVRSRTPFASTTATAAVSTGQLLTSSSALTLENYGSALGQCIEERLVGVHELPVVVL